MLGTGDGAGVGEGAIPHPFRRRNLFVTLGEPLVTGIRIVSVGQGQGRGTDELRMQPILGAGRIAAQAVDAEGELLELFELGRRLLVFAFFDGLFFLADEVGFHPLELFHEIVLDDHQVPLDGKVRQRLDTHLFVGIVPHGGLAG